MQSELNCGRLGRLEELVALALKHASRANLIGYGKVPVSAQAKAVRELDLDLAASELRLAIARGFKDLRKLDSDALPTQDSHPPWTSPRRRNPRCPRRIA